MAAWLKERDVSHVGMWSNGVYWQQVHNLLEDEFTFMVVNAAPHQEGARTQDRREGCRVDRRAAAARSGAGQLHTRRTPA